MKSLAMFFTQKLLEVLGENEDLTMSLESGEDRFILTLGWGDSSEAHFQLEGSLQDDIPVILDQLGHSGLVGWTCTSDGDEVRLEIWKLE